MTNGQLNTRIASLLVSRTFVEPIRTKADLIFKRVFCDWLSKNTHHHHTPLSII